MPRLARVGLAAGAGAVALPAALALQQRADRASILRDPVHEILSHPPAGRPVRVASSDGTALHAEVFGPDDAPTVVLVHGWTCALRFWIHQVRDLARDHRVVVYDQRGHGLSEPARSGSYTTGALADDLASVLDACVPGGERVLVTGHSMGAMTVVSWAGRHPEQVERRLCGAALVSTGMGDLLDESHVLRMPRRLHPLRHALAEQLVALEAPSLRALSPLTLRVLRRLAFGPDAGWATVAFHGDMFVQARRAARGRWGQALATLDLYDDLPALRVPTLVVVGDRDRLTPVSHARRLTALLPSPLGMVEIPGPGHMAPLEAPVRVSELLRELATSRLVRPQSAA